VLKEHGNGIFTELLQKELSKRRENHVETDYPGDAKLVGVIKGIGKIYHRVGVDRDSSAWPCQALSLQEG
jgi:hypothetical protein